MTNPSLRLPALFGAGLALAGAALAQAQPPSFKGPVLVHAGNEMLGKSRLFPSPVYHDMNGDGRLDIVVGDLRGHLTYALRVPGDGPAAFGNEQKLVDAEGKVLDFANW